MFVATLFDYNGVLVDDEAVHLAAFRDTLDPLGVVVSEAEYWERYIGFDDAGGFRAMLEDAGRAAPDALVHELVERKRPKYLARAKGTLTAFEGAVELVRRCAGRGPVGVVSGALRDEILLGLELLGLRDQIAFVVAAEDAPRCKPDPEGYQKGLALLGAGPGDRDPRAVLVVEDSVAGIRSAKAAGLTCVAVAHSAPGEALARAGADQVFERIASVHDRDLAALWRRLHG